jgi:putative ABC transport system substrate-binding protein
MNRREVIAGLGVMAAWPRATVAQRRPDLPVIGFLGSSTPEAFPMMADFHQGLKESGYVEGQNVTIEYRWQTINTIGYQN